MSKGPLGIKSDQSRESSGPQEQSCSLLWRISVPHTLLPSASMPSRPECRCLSGA